MKKLGKLVAFITIAGAAVAGFWYFLDRMKEDEFYKDLDFEDEEDEEDEENEASEESAERAYVSLDTSEEKLAEVEAANKRSLKEAVKSVAQDMKQKAEDIAKGVGVVKAEDKEEASDFAFESFDEATKETEVAAVEETAE